MIKRLRDKKILNWDDTTFVKPRTKDLLTARKMEKKRTMKEERLKKAAMELEKIDETKRKKEKVSQGGCQSKWQTFLSLVA